MKCEWNKFMALDLVRWNNIWPDSTEDKKSLLEFAYKYIECHGPEDEQTYYKKIIKEVFDKL